MRHERAFELTRPFLEFAEENGETVLRVRQATEQGYASVKVGGIFDFSYPSSRFRRARVQGEYGNLSPTLCSAQETLAILIRITQ